MENLLGNVTDVERETLQTAESRVLTGLWRGLYDAEPNSLIYIFTNAKHVNRSFMFAISCAIEIKMIEVKYFTIVGNLDQKLKD